MPDASLSFPKSWYPVCRSGDVRPGKTLRCRAFGLWLVIFRTETGQVSAMDATCAHMGADLSRGCVVGERLRCPLHSWEFDTAGVCRYIPATDHQIPERAQQLALHCQERYGLVFVFWKGQPTFDLPAFEYGDNALWSPAFTTPFDSPYQVLAANTFDEQHFGPVHHREFLAPPELDSRAAQHLSIRFQARVTGQRISDQLTRLLGMKQVEITIHCWGGNTMMIYNRGTPNHIVATLLPQDLNHARVFISTVAARPGNPLAALARRVMLVGAHEMTLAFLRPDIYALQGMDFKPTVLISDADHSFIEWVKYWKALPRESAHG